MYSVSTFDISKDKTLILKIWLVYTFSSYQCTFPALLKEMAKWKSENHAPTFTLIQFLPFFKSQICLVTSLRITKLLMIQSHDFFRDFPFIANRTGRNLLQQSSILLNGYAKTKNPRGAAYNLCYCSKELNNIISPRSCLHSTIFQHLKLQHLSAPVITTL